MRNNENDKNHTVEHIRLRLIIYFLNIYKKTRAQSSVSSLRISGGSDSTIGGFAFRVED